MCISNLAQLIVNNNILTGTLPSCIGNETSMVNLYFDYNFLSGPLRGIIDKLPALTAFYANDNLFVGSLPDITKLAVLQTLYVQNNILTGPVELSLNTTLQDLAFVDISGNELTGQLPSSFFTSKLPLLSFAAASNCITGTIPAEICELSSLVFLDLDGLGTAKSCRQDIFPHSTRLTSFTLKTRLSGVIPTCLFEMETLQTLHLGGNELEWRFPEDLMISSSIQQMSLSHNKLTGEICFISV
jgi:Leucine-rich repeat (LRR) protein